MKLSRHFCQGKYYPARGVKEGGEKKGTGAARSGQEWPGVARNGQEWVVAGGGQEWSGVVRNGQERPKHVTAVAWLPLHSH